MKNLYKETNSLLVQWLKGNKKFEYFLGVYLFLFGVFIYSISAWWIIQIYRSYKEFFDFYPTLIFCSGIILAIIGFRFMWSVVSTSDVRREK